MVITVAGAATAVKRILGFIAFSIPLLLALVTLISTIRRRGRRSASADQVPSAHQPEQAMSR
jgi:hypothetical protein